MLYITKYWLTIIVVYMLDQFISGGVTTFITMCEQKCYYIFR